MDPIKWFNTTTFLCLSQTRTWISNFMSWSFICSMICGERELFILLRLVKLLTITV